LISLAICVGKKPICTYFRVDKEKAKAYSRTIELNECVTKIATYQDNFYHFIAIGKNFVKLYDATEKTIIEKWE